MFLRTHSVYLLPEDNMYDTAIHSDIWHLSVKSRARALFCPEPSVSVRSSSRTARQPRRSWTNTPPLSGPYMADLRFPNLWKRTNLCGLEVRSLSSLEGREFQPICVICIRKEVALSYRARVFFNFNSPSFLIISNEFAHFAHIMSIFVQSDQPIQLLFNNNYVC